MPKVQLGVSEASFYVWKKKYGKLEFTELRESRQLRDENARLKCVVADLTLGCRQTSATGMPLSAWRKA